MQDFNDKPVAREARHPSKLRYFNHPLKEKAILVF
jgi:hypothetical protein